MNPLPIRRCDLGEEGKRWVSQSLERGHALARLVMTYLDISRGTVFAELPEDFSLRAVAQALTDGGLARAKESREATLEALVETGRQSTEDVLLVEDEFGRPHDPAVMRRPYPALVQDDEVYPWTHLPQTPQDLARFLSISSSGYPTNAFLLGRDQMPSTSSVGIDFLEGLARGIRNILVGAFDGESYVIWVSEGSR